MSSRTVVATFLLLSSISGGNCFGRLLMGMDGVAWENSNDQGPLLFREVPAANLVSVRAKISAQTAGNWSQAGVIVRAPNAIDAVAGQENWQTSWSFRGVPDPPFQHQSNAVTLGVEAELNDGDLSADELMYVRLDNMGGGSFLAYRGTGPENSITWTPQAGGAQTNANLAGINLQVGVAAGAIGALANAAVTFDWVEIQTTTQTYRDNFTYTHDFTTGVPGFNPAATTGGGIWNGVENAAAGGTPSISNPRAGECITCTWGVDGSGDFGAGANWGALIGPSGNDVTASFGAALTTGPATVYTNENVTLKRIEFNNANTYAFGGPGSITLDANTGNALVDVLAGSHEIQADVFLADNVTATAALGTTLNINAGVFLNGRTFTVGGGGTINLNNGTFASGSPGAGAVVNDGSLAGLGSVEGDYTQTAGGSLAIELGGAPVQVSGAAELGGVLDVSLADGFAPTPGSAYTVLTARSVTDQGLSLGGDGAGLFRLVVSDSSVSLVAGAIPEPATLALVACGVLAGAMMRRRRTRRTPRFHAPRENASLRRSASMAHRVPSSRRRSGGVLGSHAERGNQVMRRCRTTWVVVWLTLGLLSAPSTHAQFGTFRDDFGGATPHAAQHDYTTGTVPAGGIWTGIHNPTFGGDATTPAFFVADGFDFDGNDKSGKLFIEDLNLHLNEDGTTLGVGWEGVRNNAPFLFRSIPADSKFTATMKIDAQTAGQWSYTPIIARLAGNPVGVGLGGTPAATESFVTMGSFRTDPANPGAASLLTQNVVNTAEAETNTGIPAVESVLPLYVRMTKIGAQFESSTSLDGTTFTVRNTVVNAELNTAGEMLEVGPSFMMFTGGSGSTDIDFFEITVAANPVLTMASWTGEAGSQGSGDWGDPDNWDADLPGVPISATTVNVTLGATANVAGPTTVYTNAPRTIKSLTLNNANTYAVAGPGALTFQADVGNPSINVTAGSHEIQVDTAISGPLTIAAQPGTQLDFNNQFDFVAPNRTVAVSGGGKVNFNNNINLAVNGVVNVNSTGVFGGTGRVNGTLNNNAGGTVAPGTSAGTLTVDGNYVQNATGALAIEIGGTAASTFDKLVVGGAAQLNNGTLNVSLINGFTPSAAATFQILSATGNLVASTRFGNTPGNILTTPFGTFNVTYTYGANGNVTLSNFMAAVGVPGDYNDNGVVDAADYVLWRNGGPLENDPTPGVQAADYTFWRANFGNTSPGSGSSRTDLVAVPEPGLLALLSVVAMCGIGWVRRC